MDIVTEAINMYENLPRSKRNKLYTAVMNNPEFPFRDDPDDSYAGRWFIIATGDYEAPASRDKLDKIVNLICKEMKYNSQEKNKMYTIYIKEIHEINKFEHK